MDRILLIEDEAGAQLLFKNRLEDLGYEVVVASTGAKGLMEARAAHFDLFLVDIGLGSGIDGYEVCRRLKTMPAIHSVPVVLISGQVKGQEELHTGYEAGCEAYLLKNDVTLLEDVVRAMLRLKSLQDDLALQNHLLDEQNKRLQHERQRGADLEVALRESGSRALVFRELAAGRPDGILLVDSEGVVRMSDRGARDILGKGLEGRNLGAVAPDSGLEAFVRDARTEPREAHRFDLVGHQIVRSLTASVLPMVPKEGGNNVHKAVLLFDASKRRVAAEMLRLEEQGIPRRELGPLLEAARERFHPKLLLGRSDSMRELRSTVSHLATKDVPVLILGDTGTGKGVVGRTLHFFGMSSGPFVPAHCAAISSTLLESELFGHVKGAFEEAVADRPGLFQQAHHGTIFLDEISQVSRDVQTRILRALQDGEVCRVGSTSVEAVDVRLIATSSVDLESLVQRGEFNKDLYYRLSAGLIYLAPLAERKGDVELLAEHFLQLFSGGREGLELSHDALWTLKLYDWPGNVRELMNTIDRACSLAQDSVIEVSDLPQPLQDLHRRLEGDKVIPAAPARGPAPNQSYSHFAGTESFASEPMFGEDHPVSLAHYEMLCLKRALEVSKGDKRAAAKMLGIGKSTFYRKLSAHGI